MARGRKTSLMIRLTPAERQTLLAWQRATTISAGRARRGRIILLVADRVPISDVATTVGISRRFVYKWVQRFAQEWPGGAGRQTRPRPSECAAPAYSNGAARRERVTHLSRRGRARFRVTNSVRRCRLAQRIHQR